MSEIIIKDGIEFKKCKGIEQYAASKCGQVIRVSTNKHMSQFLQGIPNYKYVRVSVNNKPGAERVHRLVAMAWLENDDPENKIQVNHIDGDKLNNHVTNLEWVTRSQNQRHAVETGLKGKGDALYNSELTDEQVHEICSKLVEGFTVKDLSEMYLVSKDIIRKIRAGDTYFHVRQLYEVPHTYKHDFSYSTVVWVCEQIVKGLSDREIVKNSSNENLTIIEIKRIRYKIRYKSISNEFF